MFNVSRLSLREGLSGLQAMGLIQARQGSGWFVQSFDPADRFKVFSPLIRNFSGGDLDQFMEVRIALEPLVARIAAERISSEGLDELNKCLEGMASSKKNLDKFVDFDMSFHTVLAKECGNQILNVLCTILIDLNRTVHSDFPQDDLGLLLETHRNIYEAVKAGDCKLAEERMKNHMREVWDFLKKHA